MTSESTSRRTSVAELNDLTFPLHRQRTFSNEMKRRSIVEARRDELKRNGDSKRRERTAKTMSESPQMFPFQDHELPRSTSEISRARRRAALKNVLEERIRRITAEENRMAIRRESQARRLRHKEYADILRQVSDVENPPGYAITDRFKEAFDTTGRAVREVARGVVNTTGRAVRDRVPDNWIKFKNMAPAVRDRLKEAALAAPAVRDRLKDAARAAMTSRLNPFATRR